VSRFALKPEVPVCFRTTRNVLVVVLRSAGTAPAIHLWLQDRDDGIDPGAQLTLARAGAWFRFGGSAGSNRLVLVVCWIPARLQVQLSTRMTRPVG